MQMIGAYRLTSFAATLWMPAMVAAGLNRIFAGEEGREEPTDEQKAAVTEFMPFYSRDSEHAYKSGLAATRAGGNRWEVDGHSRLEARRRKPIRRFRERHDMVEGRLLDLIVVEVRLIRD